MKLTKINYNSAVFFGALALVMYLIAGILQWSLRDVLATQGINVTAVSAFVTAPVLGGVIGYLSMVVIIAIYNFVAKRYPISWDVSKK
ncbi:hypothetical protein HN903_01225 [archaeon]|jgi:hypothetical protein|nr:hypothetical protein [archaeon]MBT7128353.1 hypothetical protein [archaeon]